MKLKEGYIEVPDDDSVPISGARYSAIMVLSRFERSDSYLDRLVAYELTNSKLNHLDKGLFTELVNGVIRWKGKLDYVLVGFYQGDYLKCLNVVKNALRVALYQILFLNKIPVSAAINESVEIVKNIQGDKTAGIVNGVLRTITRNIDNIRYPEKDDDPIYYYSVVYSHPRWMIRRWIDRFGEAETEQILVKNNQRPYLPLRVNTLKASSEEIAAVLADMKFNYYTSKYFPNTFILKTSRADIASLEIFRKGKVTAQDPAASLAAMLAAPKPGETVIDFCSAPGGKAFLMAELMIDKGRIVSVDKYNNKINLIAEGARRLGFNSIETIVADARTVEFDFLADTVFVDAPCTGLGTLSKKPDIKWKKEREDVYKMSELQREIITNAVKYVKPGGILVYSTCSIEPEENQANAEWFLENYPDFTLEPAQNFIHKEVVSNGYLATMPHIHHIDGAFAARFRRKQ
jgi:16S rRNA (cytosine967-C5)-methyltransferase